MNWFKKSQFDNISIVKNILDKNINGSIEQAVAEIQSSVQNPCQTLYSICNGNLVNPFYMNVWSFLCGDNANENQNQVQEQPHQEAEISEM